jgi:hypothetical protein
MAGIYILVLHSYRPAIVRSVPRPRTRKKKAKTSDHPSASPMQPSFICLFAFSLFSFSTEQKKLSPDVSHHME